MSDKTYDDFTGRFMDYQEYQATYGEYVAKKYFKPIGKKKNNYTFRKTLPAKATSAEMADDRAFITKSNHEKDRTVFESNEDWDALIAAGKKIREQAYSAPKSNIKEQHIRLGIGFVKNPIRLKQNANKTMLNIFFRNSVWKNHHPKDKYNLHYHYFTKQRKLAACWAIETLADLFDVSEKTIRRWRDELVVEGSMTVVKRYNKPDIYIMGEVDEDGNEKYYADKMDKYVH